MRTLSERLREPTEQNAYIAPGSRWENEYVGSLNARLHDVLLDGEISYTVQSAQIVIKSWQHHYKLSDRVSRLALSHQRPSRQFQHSPRAA